MASGRLGAHKSTTSGTFNVYTVPSGKTAEVNISVFNGSGTTSKVTLFRSPTGSPTSVHSIQLDSISNGSGYERTALVLKAGEWISYTTDSAGMAVVVNGVEYASASNEIKVQTLINSSTETVIYDNAVAKAGTVNICVSLIHASDPSHTANCALYTSDSNAASGYQLLNATVSTTGNSGFEKTGFPISATNKIILVTTGLIGSVSSCVSGYTKE